MAVSPYSAELADIVGWAEHRFVSRGTGAGPAAERTDSLPSPDVGQTAPHVDNTAEPAPPSALLLLGRSGTGKSHLLRELLHHAAGTVLAEQDVQQPSSWWSRGDPRAVVIEGESIYQSKAPLERLNLIFDEVAAATTPFVLVLEHLDALCPAGGGNGSAAALEVQVVASVCRRIDQLGLPSARHTGFIVATSSRPDAIHPAVRRHGRFGLTVSIGAPTTNQRATILASLLVDTPVADLGSPDAPDVGGGGLVGVVAARTPGFVAADLRLLCQEAVMLAIKGIDADGSDAGPGSVRLGLLHFDKALLRTRPAHLADFPSSMMRSEASLAGVDAIFEDLRHAAELCLTNPERCKAQGVRPPRGLLILGPAGVGKTSLALALASSLQVNVLPVPASSVRAKVVGEAEQALTRLFQRALDSQPCVLLIDQLDGIAGAGDPSQSRRGDAQARIMACLTALVDECVGTDHAKILVIGTCREIQDLDPAIYRPGRLDMHFHVPLPDAATRTEIVNLNLERMPGARHLAGTPAIQQLIKDAEGTTGAVLENICREAALLGLRDDLHRAELTADHFVAALAAMGGQ